MHAERNAGPSTSRLATAAAIVVVIAIAREAAFRRNRARFGPVDQRGSRAA